MAGCRRRAETEQKREGGVGIHVERERQQHRRSGEAADSGDDAEYEPHDAAERQEHQAVGLHERQEGLARGDGHEAEFSADHVHLFRS